MYKRNNWQKTRFAPKILLVMQIDFFPMLESIGCIELQKCTINFTFNFQVFGEYHKDIQRGTSICRG